ncbi:MAG: CDP-diacylglycerol--serine O-phosphatidyltransferase [Muribaculaceae bacterium]
MKILNTIKNNIPNSITCLNLVSGAIACIYALRGNVDFGGIYGYQIAFIMIAAAAVFDFCDGLVARLLHAVSAIGKELDSLCDAVSFGLAPALLVYRFMSNANPDSLLPFVALAIAVCGVLRLARFNVDATQTTSFLGMPIPANAIFWIGYCNMLYSHPECYTSAADEYLLAALVIAISLTMVCRLRMFSFKFKNFSLSGNWHRYLLIAAAIVLVALQGVTGLASTIAVYIVLSVFTHSRTKREG